MSSQDPLKTDNDPKALLFTNKIGAEQKAADEWSIIIPSSIVGKNDPQQFLIEAFKHAMHTHKKLNGKDPKQITIRMTKPPAESDRMTLYKYFNTHKLFDAISPEIEWSSKQKEFIFVLKTKAIKLFADYLQKRESISNISSKLRGPD